MKIPIIVVLLFFVSGSFAQIKPDFFPEDISSEAIAVRCFCKPGVQNKSRAKGLEISYNWLGAGTFMDEEGNFSSPLSKYGSWTQLELDFKVPVINKDNLKMLFGYKFSSEAFNISQYGRDQTETFRELDATNLKGNSLSVILIKPLNETSYLSIRARYSANGNYLGLIDFRSQFAIYKGLIFYGVKPNENLEWGFGLNVSGGFRQSTILPFFLYNRNFDDRWGIETALPAYLFARYNLSKKSILLVGAEYNSNSYRMEAMQTSGQLFDYALNHSEVIGSLRLEKQLSSWIWANIKVGYQLNFSTDFDSKSVITNSFQVEPSDGFFIRIGAFISHPDPISHQK